MSFSIIMFSYAEFNGDSESENRFSKILIDHEILRF